VTLLSDIWSVFLARGVDRIASENLVGAVHESSDGLWSEWQGLRGDQQPRRLSQGELARLLAPFAIRPKTIWPWRRDS
jgi:hypothetical protein